MELTMKSAELKSKNLKELETLLGDYKKELFNLRFQKVNGSLTNTARVTLVKTLGFAAPFGISIIDEIIFLSQKSCQSIFLQEENS